MDDDVALERRLPVVRAVDVARHEHGKAPAGVAVDVVGQKGVLEVGFAGLVQFDHFDRGIGEQVLGAAEGDGVVRAAEGVAPLRPVEIERQAWQKEHFAAKRVDRAFHRFGQAVDLPGSGGQQDRVLQLARLHLVGEVIGKAHAGRVEPVAQGAGDVAVDGGRRRDVERRLHLHDELRVAKGGRQPLGGDFQDAHGDP